MSIVWKCGFVIAKRQPKNGVKWRSIAPKVLSFEDICQHFDHGARREHHDVRLLLQLHDLLTPHGAAIHAQLQLHRESAQYHSN